MSVGIDLIDEQHKELIQHLNNLDESIATRQGPTRISEMLEFLANYTHFHFDAEEKHMAGNDYPALEAHVAQHNEFKRTLANLRDEFSEDGATHLLADSIDTLLSDWLVEHICGIDRKFGAFLAEKGVTELHDS